MSQDPDQACAVSQTSSRPHNRTDMTWGTAGLGERDDRKPERGHGVGETNDST